MDFVHRPFGQFVVRFFERDQDLVVSAYFATSSVDKLRAGAVVGLRSERGRKPQIQLRPLPTWEHWGTHRTWPLHGYQAGRNQ